jgi:type II secretory pathway component PulK
MRSRRHASALVLTLIVVAMLTLGAAAFFQRMFAEHQAERAHGQQLQAENVAESGVEYIKMLLKRDPQEILTQGGLYANPSLFQGVMVNDDSLDKLRGYLTIVSPDLTRDGYYSGIRYGLENESSRLNLNMVLLAESSTPGSGKKLLMALPGMTDEIADAILDWIDRDDEPRENGAERDYYASLSPPYAPRNGPLGSMEELLLVKGVTPALLFGADLNRNGVIDGNEQNLTSIDNTDNSAGYLDRGWAAYLTVDSAEANVRPDGKPKINVNMDDLTELHKELLEVLDKDQADFIVAFRQGGAYTGNDSAKPVSSVQVDLTQQGKEKLNTILDLIGVKTRIAKNNSSQGSDGGGPTGAPSLGGTSPAQPQSQPSREAGGKGQGASVATQAAAAGGSGGNKSSLIVIEPAFPNDRAAMTTYLPKLMDNLAVNASPTIPGRLNINQASRILLAGIPYFTSDQVDQILSNRDVTMGQQHPEQKYETWLLSDSVVELAMMKKLMPLVTGGGSVYRAQVVGGFFSDANGPTHRLEVLIDASKTPAVVRRRWELKDLGRGYTPDVLGAPAEDSP